jgi:glycerophosphoryl diester phosphodiesterase
MECKLLTLGLIMAQLNIIEVQGHRGMGSPYPGNTLPSFEAAIDAGVDTIELDVLSSLDGHLVIHHDFYSHDKKSLIRNLTLPEIKKQSNEAEMPTLQELLDLVYHSRNQNVRLNIEIKRDPRDPKLTISPKEMAQKIVKQVEKSGLKSRVYYSSFDPESLFAIKKEDSNTTIGLIFDPALLNGQTKEFLKRVQSSMKVDILSPNHEFLTDEAIMKELKKTGQRIIPWTVNKSSRWQELIDMGVDGIITDVPHELILFIN